MRVSRDIVREGVAMHMSMDKDPEYDFIEAYVGQAWERSSFIALDAILKPGDILFDIGAWVGPYTLWYAKHGVRVVAIEPDPTALVYLKENIEANGLDELVHVERAALMPQIGNVSMRVAANGGGDSTSSVTRTTLPDTITVKTTTLDDLIDKYGVPDAVKMDIEGGESLVLPVCGPRLRELGVPMALSLHWHWFAEGTNAIVQAELDHWDMELLDNEVFMCRPKVVA